MRAWFACSGAELLARDPADTVRRLASAQQARGFSGTPDQEMAWQAQLRALQAAVAACGGAAWTVALEFDLLRLEKRIDAVLLTDRAILCLEFKTAAPTNAALAEAEDYALDLRDFHAGSRDHAIVPVLVAGTGGWAPPVQPWLLPKHPTDPLVCGAEALAGLIRWVQATLPASALPIDGAAWLEAPYRPVPTIVEAATMLYARNGVAEIAAARADAANLTRTARAIARHIEAARAAAARTVIFVTGIPGAGKTLCGLNAVFGPARVDGAAFLTGNAPLVAVLRAALARDAVARGECDRAEAERRTQAALQNVHRFLEDCAIDPARLPPERLIVFDEAQRAWDQAKSLTGTQNKRSRLTMSEPAHTLEIMGRRAGWSVVVALIGNGQEINTGEAGLAEWGRVVAANSRWRAAAAPRALAATDPVQRLAEGTPAWLEIDADLDLVVPMRSVRETAGAAWVNALLDGETAEARRIAEAAPALPYLVTRDLAALRAGLRGFARGQRRAGLVRAAGARRLRAEGLGAEVPTKEVPDWFLRRWPDIRASDALETAATEYACQGLELDVVGLAWGGDFVRGRAGWSARGFVGDKWQIAAKDADFIRNTYRVLLTRARYETVIWVPRGSPAEDPFHDRTRSAAEMDAIADYLLACGARPLDAAALPRPAPPAQAGLFAGP
ncbi:DNA/RNA helicase domain-containing protein [Dankookia sp. GCM10030260]|uniref:DNA/RNA helicase domain-containing protein n=1 Tax=Dankookia sp. GCM10030260 TaxID=3273390 RepID=UPI0036235574